MRMSEKINYAQNDVLQEKLVYSSVILFKKGKTYF